MAVMMAGTMAACGMGDVGGASSAAASQAVSSQAPVSKPSADSFDNSLTGLGKYLAANSVLSGDPTEMKAEFIGAAKGVKYQFAYNGKDNVTVELYEFNPDNLSDTAKTVQADVKVRAALLLWGSRFPQYFPTAGNI